MLTPLLNREALMSRPKEFIDEHGVKWVTSARVAEIWNERTWQEKGIEGNYTRWSVYQRRKQIAQKLTTPNGDLYLESEMWKIPLAPHPKRPDITRDRKGKKKHEIYPTKDKEKEQ